jgi:hypothetical protein
MLFGRIARFSHPIDLAEWEDLIATRHDLKAMHDRHGINPFTKEKVVFPGKGKAIFLVNGAPAGNAGLQNGEILTTSIPADICEELAAALNAEVFEDDRS